MKLQADTVLIPQAKAKGSSAIGPEALALGEFKVGFRSRFGRDLDLDLDLDLEPQKCKSVEIKSKSWDVNVEIGFGPSRFRL
jgi:hypothetical protein